MARAKNQYALPLRLEDVIRSGKNSPAHKGRLRHSIDFECEEGSRIYAALGGMVVFVRDNSNVGGPHKRYWFDGNRIVIKHINDEYSAYEHLRFEGSNVEVGQRVRKGQLIGYSGNTGFSYRPHLHFEIFNEPDDDESEGTTLQVSMRGLLEGASK